jgi:hypothetical protein
MKQNSLPKKTHRYTQEKFRRKSSFSREKMEEVELLKRERLHKGYIFSWASMTFGLEGPYEVFPSSTSLSFLSINSAATIRQNISLQLLAVLLKLFV